MNDQEEKNQQEKDTQQENGAGHPEGRSAKDEQLLEDARQIWLRSSAGQMCLELYAKFEEYRKFVSRFASKDDPCAEWCRQPEHLAMLDAMKAARAYDMERAERNRKNLEKARQAARCQHVYMDGEQCGAPRLREGTLCRMHQGIEDARAVKLDLGPLEDPDSIQAGIRKLVAAIVDGKVERSQASHLGYLLQLALANVMRTSTAMRAREA